MHTINSIKKISELCPGHQINIPDIAGVYAFWWLGGLDELLSANRHIVLKGPGGVLVDIEFNDWWPDELIYPCLYVGKSTNLRKRFGQHLMRSSLGRCHFIPSSNVKKKAKTTSCQLRYGIEHLFNHHSEPLDIIYQKVGFSYMTHFSGNPVIERFYKETELIGAWRPWFNIDSER